MGTSEVFPGDPDGRSLARSFMREYDRAALKRREKRKETEEKNFDLSGEKGLEISSHVFQCPRETYSGANKNL